MVFQLIGDCWLSGETRQDLKVSTKGWEEG